MSKKFLAKEGIYFFSILCALILPAQVYALDAALSRVFESQRRFIDEEYIRELKKTEKAIFLKKEELFKFESGGLLSSVYRLYRNLDNDPSTKDTVFGILSEDLWLWGKVVFQNGNYAYLRVRESYTQRENSSIYTGVPAGGDNEGPLLDMAYFSLRSGEHNLNIGRQYFSIGRGIAYSDTNDGILLSSYSPQKWLCRGFFAHSLPHEDNLDYSIPGYDKDSNDRYFLGFEVGRLGKPTDALYAFYLIQRDLSKPHPDDDAQPYRYNSQYFGLGFNAKKVGFSTWGELIKEIGSSYTDSSAGPIMKKPVDAWAAILGLRYEFDQALQPASEIEFAYGSGDKDRSSVTNTKSGGNINHNDKNFLYFGNYYGGYALSPRLSNLIIFKIDQSLKPFYFTRSFKDITLGAKFFAYLKDQEDGGISDTDATIDKRWAGTELDLYFYWTITKDLNFILRYGVFYPGNAYSEDTDTNTKYLYTRLTLTF